ncbi:MAG: 16S rRNA (cytosine(1402)-N(4))-methyltransferase RsmH [Planctomycetaceae bacterium]|nr:16S rRNA (cytosine(1402)-N(4))-methyltransferase RsmH [Planctomycetaceae bacterium]
MTTHPTEHIPVLSDEIIQILAPSTGQIFVDGTAGGGGHLLAMAALLAPAGLAIGVDRDPAAIERLESLESELPVQFACSSYARIPDLLSKLDIKGVDSILLDLGLSSDQLAAVDRGFSFNVDGPLDLRFNPQTGEPAWRMISRMSAEHLANLIYEFGEERQSRRIARAIVAAREREPIRTSQQLAQIIRKSIGSRSRNERIDPATRTFQALRIAVNDELKELDAALKVLPDCLLPGGSLAIISFHSLEDRRVKQSFRNDLRLDVVTRKPIRPTETEVVRNSRSRSAKLRVARRM